MPKRKCKQCGERKDRDTMTIRGVLAFCDIDCQVGYGLANQHKGKAIKQKAERKAHTAKKKELLDNDKSHQNGVAQKLFNKFIRIRDEGQLCISCQRPPKKKNAGHYLSRGARRDLRFNEGNCHLQCEHCNSFKSGNQAIYRVNLIAKIGLSAVEQLERYSVKKDYSIDELKTIQKWYKRKIKRLQGE